MKSTSCRNYLVSQSSEPFFCNRCRFRELRLVGPEVEAVGGVGGAHGHSPGGGLRTAARFCVGLCLLLSGGVVAGRN